MIKLFEECEQGSRFIYVYLQLYLIFEELLLLLNMYGTDKERVQ